MPRPPTERPHFFVTTVPLDCQRPLACGYVPAGDYALAFGPKRRLVHVNVGESTPIGFRMRSREVVEVLARLESAEAIYVPVVALGELRSGFLGGKRPAQNEKRLSWFLAQDRVFTLGLDAPVSHRYAALHRALRAKGGPIPTNDMWIAAIALEHGLVLYTRDEHFDVVPGLACL